VTDNHFSAVLTVREFPSPCEDRYHVTILRRNGQVANTGRSFETKREAHLFCEGLDMQARIMSNGKTRVLVDELTASESVDFWLAGKVGPLTGPQIVALSAVRAGAPYDSCATPGEFARRSRVLDRMIDRGYVKSRYEDAPGDDCAEFHLTPSGEKALKNATSSDDDAAMGLDRLNPPGLR